MPIYTVNGSKYNIPDEKIEAFERKYPNAEVEMYDNDGTRYSLPISKRTAFQTKFDKWSYAKPEAKQQEAPAAQSEESPAADLQPQQQSQMAQEAPLTEEEKQAYLSGLGSMRQSVDKSMQQFQETTQNLMDYSKSGAALTGGVADGGFAVNPESGKVEQSFITSDGTRTFDKQKAENEILLDRMEADMSVSAQLRRAHRRLAELKAKAANSAMAVDKRYEEEMLPKFKKNPLAMLAAMDTYRGMQMGDSENAAYRTAIHEQEELIKNLEEQRDRERGKSVGFWRGFGRAAGDVRTWDFGVGNLLDMLTMMNADQLIDENATESQKQAYQDMMQAIYEKQQSELEYSDNASFLNRAGVMTGYMPAFMVDFALTGGGFRSMKFVGKAATEKATKIIGEEVVEEMAKQGFKNYVKKNGVKGLAQEAGNWTIKAAGTLVDDLLIRAPLMTNTIQAAETATDIMERKLGNVIVNPDGTYDFSNDKTWGSAIWQGEANAIIENYSEMFGEHLDPLMTLENASKIANLIGAKRLGAVLAKADANALGGIMNTTHQLFNKIGVSDYLGEVTEEYYGQLWRTALNLDDAYIYNADGSRTNLLAPGTGFHGDIWGGMLLSMGAIGLAKHGLTASIYASKKHSVSKADAKAGDVLGTDVWESLRTIIDNTTNEDMGTLVQSMMADSQFTDAEKEAILEYAGSSMVFRGYNLGTLAQSRGAEGNPLQEKANESWMDGYNMTSPQEMNDAKNMLSLQRARLEGMLTESDMQFVDNITSGYIEYQGEGDVFTREQVDAINDYLNAKNVYDGMIQHVRDELDTSIDDSNAKIDAHVNAQTGRIHPATMKDNDRKVYVISGVVVPYQDGTGIDLSASDESIIVRDAETGEMQQISPSALLSVDESQDPQEQKDLAAESIRQQLSQEWADKIDGAVTYNAGDTYEVVDDGGNVAQLTIVANEQGMVQNPDGTINVSINGAPSAPMAPDAIQSMVDASRMKRVTDFETQRMEHNDQLNAVAEEIERPQYALNDTVTLRDAEGNEVRGSITADEDADGRFEVYTEQPFNGRKVNLFTRDELDSFTTQKNGEQVEQPASVEETPAVEESALSRIPKDAQGNPLYEQADSDTAWDAIVEETGGDYAMAQSVADSMLADKETALKKAEKAKPKAAATISEKIAAERERNEAIEAARQQVDIWKKIAGTQLRRRQEIDAQRRREAEERAAQIRAEEERLKAEREEAARIEREALNGVPDMVDDTPQNARARGYRRVTGHKVDRQQPLEHAQGKAVSVKFSDDTIADGHVAVIDAESLQPSHLNGQRNPFHFIDEAQPKERNDEASVLAARKIAGAIRPEEITTSVTAYTGAPSVNARGEVIQGNNRGDALRQMWGEHKDQAAIYKQYLVDHAAEFGLDAAAIEAMEQPVLVNMLDVDDNEAISLGQYVAQDTESGGIERIKPKNAVMKMGKDMGTFASLLLQSADDETSFAGLVDKNGFETLKWMNQRGYITPTQFQSAFDTKGNLTAEIKNDLKGIMYQGIFTGGSTQLEEMFNALPAKAQRAILSTAYRDYESPLAERMVKEIQDSIMAFYYLSFEQDFAAAKNFKEAHAAVESWKVQAQIDDVTGDAYLPAEKFSNFALHLATMYKGESQSLIQSTFNHLFDLIQGTQEATLFEQPDNTPRSLAQAINETLNFEYDGQQRSNVLAGDSSASEEGEQGSSRGIETGERVESGEQSTDSAERTDSDSGGSRNKEHLAERQGDMGTSVITSDTEFDEDGLPFVLSSSGTTVFGEIKAETGLTPAPIKLSRGNSKYGLIHLEKRHGEQIRNAGFDSVEEFVEYVCQNYKRIRQGENSVGESNGTYLLQIEDSHNNTLYVELSTDGSYWGVNSGGVFRNEYGSNKKEVWSASEVQNKQSATDSTLQGEEKSDNQTPPNGNVPATSESKGSENSRTSNELGEKIAEEESKVNTNPTDAQKEAGNYKKGHIQVGSFDVTIENPKGSIRSGVDAQGNKWETKMNNTYGYIRGTEGVDGDHIDVFLSDNIDEWNGARVFIIDQYNPDGTFDEHKVMLGFNEQEEAEAAYLSNYDEEWASGRRLDGSTVLMEDFEKWIQSSHRKTKPFAEYKHAVRHEVNESDVVSEGYSIEHRKDTRDDSDLYAVKFEERVGKDEFKGQKAIAKKHGGYWSNFGKKGFLFKTQEAAQAFADEVMGKDSEQVADEAPITLSDVKEVNVEGLFADLHSKGETKLSDHAQPVRMFESIKARLIDEILNDKDFKMEREAPQNSAELIRTRAKEVATKYVTDMITADGKTMSEATTQLAKLVFDNFDTFYEEIKAKIEHNAPVNPSGNKLVTDERYEELKKRMMSKLGQLNVGIDPEILAIGTEMAVYHIEKGARKFVEYAKNMIADLGDAIRPYLKAFYNGARELPEMESFAEEMTSYDEVRTLNVAEIGKEHVSPIEVAETVVAEQQHIREAEESSETIKSKRNETRREKNERTAADTEAIVSEAEALAGSEETGEEAIAKIDETLAKIDGQLDKLGIDTLVESRATLVLKDGRKVNILYVIHQGEQIGVAQFSKPWISRIYGFDESKKLVDFDPDKVDIEASRLYNERNEVTEHVEEPTPEEKSKRPAKWKDLKVGDKVMYKGEVATVHTFEEYGDQQPVLDTGMAPVIYEVADWADISEVTDEQPKKSAKKAKSDKKSVSLQAEETNLFSSLFGTETNEEDELPRNDASRSAGLSADSRGHERGLSGGTESSGEKQEQASRGVERSGENRSSELDRSVRSGLSDSVESPKNRNNNHSERGANHAPASENARIEANIKAIELAKELLESGEKATPAQMKVLRKFSGWGGLGSAFNESAFTRSPYARQLRELLGDEAYEQAVMSANSAYYTPAYVVDTLWDIAVKLGFKGGNILEGSAGIGNILGQMPMEISDRSDIRAVEIDSTAGGILSLLYPDAQVEIKGFEEDRIPNGSIDLAITNVPFVTGLHVNDTSGDSDLSKKFRNIHDFCIAKNVRKLREGGIGIFITSSGTLDSSKKLRDWIVSEGGSDFIGAFRMNNKTFGGTSVTSDIIVIRKRVNAQKSAQAIDVSDVVGVRTAEINTGEVKKVKGSYEPVVKTLAMEYNKYFVEHPERMAGEMFFAAEQDEMYRATSKSLYPVKEKDQKQMLADFVETFTAEEVQRSTENRSSARGQYVSDASSEGKKVGEMYVRDGKLVIASLDGYYPLEVNDNKVKGHTKAECFEAYTAIKTALADVLKYQTENGDDAGLEPLLAKLNKAYDDFVKTYGHFNKNTAIAFLKNDVDFSSIFALEKYEERADATGQKVASFGKTDVFSRRVVEQETEPHPTNVKDGIVASMFKFGRIDIPYIAEQLGVEEAELRRDILESGLGFENPVSMQVEVSYQYLSGNVREKLRQAEENNADGKYDANIKALQEVVPMDIPAHLIDFTLGSSWVDPKLYEDYVKERTGITVKFTSVGGTWFMKAPDWGLNTEQNRSMGVISELCRKTIMGHTLIEAAIQNKTVTVSETRRNYDGTTETITDREATQACTNKIDEIRHDFKDWARGKMQEDAEMSAKMTQVYNDMFNNYVPMSIPDEFVPEYFGGASHKFKMRPHQGRAIVRGTMQPLLLAHEVGTGKTFTLISTAMEMRRLGTARKPMIVVQNATVGQFVASAKELYPNAKILTLEDSDRSAEGRRNFYAKIKYNDWDMIVVPQSTFEFIPDSEERRIAFIQSKIDEKMMILEKMKQEDPNEKSIITRQAKKEIDELKDEIAAIVRGGSEESEAPAGKKSKKKDAKRDAKTRQNARVQAEEMLDRRVDDVENFDEMGIDALLVDEAHEYKHLGFATAMQRGVKGVDPSYSKKSQGVFLKVQSVLEKNNGRNVIFATGTPISNTAAEIWTFMRYLMPEDTMKDYGIYYFDDFVRNFGSITQMLEFSTSGKFKENNRFAGYVNLPELVRIWSGVSDTVLTREADGVKDEIPEMEDGKAQDIYLPQTRALRAIMKYVKAQLEKYDKMSGKEKRENSHIPLTMYGIAKAAAVDARLVQADAEDDPNSKTNEAVRQTLRSLKETESYKGTIAIFADNYQNKDSGFNLYEDIRTKLIAEGVPADQIVIIKSGMTVKKKLEIFDKVNRGEIRVIMGSTFTLGTGVNIQERLHTLIHLDAPNRPMDYTQRNGRILRQGNIHKDMGKPVRVLRFGVEDSLDVTAYQRLKTKGAIADSIMNGKQMLADSMTTRVLEEEEDVFGDTVAQLSGSEYAMLKNSAERTVRKYESRKKQWQADQTYIHNAKRTKALDIERMKKAIESNKNYLAVIESTFPDGKVVKIEADGKSFASVKAMEKFLKEHNSGQLAKMKKMKETTSVGEDAEQIVIKLNGLTFLVTTKFTRGVDHTPSGLMTRVSRKMTYTCATLGLTDVPVNMNMLQNFMEDATENIATGKKFREWIDRGERNLQRTQSELEQVLAREGVPFEFDEELEKAKAQLAEYTELMKKELAEKEAKYAQMDAEVEAVDGLSDMEEDEDDTMYRIEELDGNDTLNYDNALDIPVGSVHDALEVAHALINSWKADFRDAIDYILDVDYSTFNMPRELVDACRAWKKGVEEDYEEWGGRAGDLHDNEEIEDMISRMLEEEGNDAPALYRSVQNDGKQDVTAYRLRNTKAPKKTGIGYKVFFLKDGQLYPPMVANPNGEGTPVGEWLDAVAAPKAGKSKTGRDKVKAGGKGTQGGGGTLAYRPGWHLGEIPYALQFNRKDEETGKRDLFPANFVWAEVEYAADVDYQKEAMSYGMTESGKFQHSLAGLPKLPVNGSYRYRTNPNPETDPWIITGAMKVNRILTPSEVDAMVKDAGREPQRRQEGAVTDEDVRSLNRDLFAVNDRAGRRSMAKRVEELAKKLNLGNVDIVMNRSELTGKKAHAKGFYTKSTGKITIVVPNNTNIADIEKTLLHEAVAHYGLRQLFGDHFDTFLDNVFQNVDEDIRKKITAMAAKNGWDFRKATEEYLASLAESTDFENAKKQSWWTKVKRFFANMLRSLGFEGYSGSISDNELRYVLWRSYENLKGGRTADLFAEAQDISMQHDLKVGEFEDDDLMRDGDPEVHGRVFARRNYERRVRSGMFQSREALQDSMLGLKEAMEAVLHGSGSKLHVEEVDGYENAYLGENRLSSVNKAEADAFAATLFKPMLDEVARLAKTDAQREELTDYMMAKHGLERNVVMAERDARDAYAAYVKQHPTGAKTLNDFINQFRGRDYAGLTALTGMDDVATAELEAEQIVNDYENLHDTADLWDRVNAVSKAILRKSYECGVMSKAAFDAVSSMYEYYIPLRGFDETTSAEAYAYLGHPQSAFNAPIKVARGRSSKADDPFANLQSMAESAIMQGNRNKLVKQRFLNFVLNHPSDLASVSELWVMYDEIVDEWKPVFPDNINADDTAEEVESKMADFESKMQALAALEPDKYKKGKDAERIPYRVVESRDMHQHQIVVKRNGRDYIITINGNPRAAQAVNGQTNPDNELTGAIGAVLRAGERINRELSAFYTTRNPDFVVSNFIRDALYSNSMAWVKESPRYALRFHRNFVGVNPAKMKSLLVKYRKGILDMSDRIESSFYQFMMNGGETGYANIRDIEKHKNDIRKELEKANGKLKVKRAMELLADRLDELNRAVENCARFAAFLTSRDFGRTIDRSIYDAKEISVNFNKKGSGAKFYDAVGQTKAGNASAMVSGLGRTGFVFWNAAIQGTTNFGRQMKRHPAKAFTSMAVLYLLGAVVAYLGGGDDDDDDKNSYYNLPEHVRRNNILFRAGDHWISIPLPVEYRAIYGMGELATSVLSGKEHKTDGEIAGEIMAQASQVLPIDFMEGGGGLNAFVPSAVKPITEAFILKKSWTGMPLYKDTPYNKDMPEWTKAYKSANRYIVGLAEVMNEVTGGDPYTKGTIDFNPAQVEYLLNGYFGGVFSTIDKMTKTAETLVGAREYDPRSFLILNRLVKSGDERTEYRAVNNEYFRLKEEHDKLKARLKHYEDDTDNGIFDYAEKIDFLYNSPEYERYEIFEDYRRDIDSLYEELKNCYDEEERKYIEAELNAVKKEMIEEMNETRKRK